MLVGAIPCGCPDWYIIILDDKARACFTNDENLAKMMREIRMIGKSYEL